MDAFLSAAQIHIDGVLCTVAIYSDKLDESRCQVVVTAGKSTSAVNTDNTEVAIAAASVAGAELVAVAENKGRARLKRALGNA